MWIYPIYGISFILNAIWYQDIADAAYIVHGNQQRKVDFSFQRYALTHGASTTWLMMLTRVPLRDGALLVDLRCVVLCCAVLCLCCACAVLVLVLVLVLV